MASSALCVVLFYGLPLLLLTLMPTIPALYSMLFLIGIGGGGKEPVGNVGCLQIWRGSPDGGPFMHAIHFGYSLGTVVGPLLATLFIGGPISREEKQPSGMPGVVQLYVIVGSVALLAGVGYVKPAVKECFSKGIRYSPIREPLQTTEEVSRTPNFKSRVFVVLMCVFFFFNEGMEVVTGTFLATFAVKSALNVTIVQGAFVTAIYWGSFAACRFLSIFLAIYLNPLSTLFMSLALCLIGSVGLVYHAWRSLLTLQLMVAVLGIGNAPLYAAGLLWMEKYVVVTNKVGAFCSFSAMTAFAFCLAIIGSFIVETPLAFAVGILVNVLSIIMVFLLAWPVGESMLVDKQPSYVTT